MKTFFFFFFFGDHLFLGEKTVWISDFGQNTVSILDDLYESDSRSMKIRLKVAYSCLTLSKKLPLPFFSNPGYAPGSNTYEEFVLFRFTADKPLLLTKMRLKATCSVLVTLLGIIPLCGSKVVIQNRGIPLYKDAPRIGGYRKPIVIVPGILGSQLNARLNKQHSLNNFRRKADWFTLWLNPKQMIPSNLDCWIDNMRVVFDNATASFKNCPGVEIQAPMFGSTIPFEYLVNSSFNVGQYFAPIVNFLSESLGYIRGVDLFGAPYDWRLGPLQQKKLFWNIRSLIEKIFYVNRRKVVVFAHSMGSPYTNYFLNSQSLGWRKRFIDSFISVGGSFYGCVKSLKGLISGDAEGFEWVIDNRKIQKLARTLPALFYMMPRKNLWPKSKETIITTTKRNYTVHDYKQLFEDIGCKECWNIYKAAATNDYKAPRVPVHCVFSDGIPTMQTLAYNKDFPNASPKIFYGEGDGTINLWSASACTHWQKAQPEPVYRLHLQNVTHSKLLWNSALRKYLASMLVTETFQN